MDAEDLAWAAGLFEGEGCVFVRSRAGSVSASLTMVDEDRVRLLHKILGVGTVIPVKPQKAGWQPAWKWSTSSHQGVQHVACLLWKHLGPRRREGFHGALVQARSRRPSRQLHRTCRCGLTTTAGPMAMHAKVCSAGLTPA